MKVVYALAAAASLAGLAGAASAAACSLDGVPSLSANGVLARLNSGRPTATNLGHWSRFVFPAPYHAGQLLRLNENQSDLKRSLLPQAFGKPWHWSFGDGASGDGYSIRHLYHRPGTYKVVVSAYYSSYKAWFQFDDALITVR